MKSILLTSIHCEFSLFGLRFTLLLEDVPFEKGSFETAGVLFIHIKGFYAGVCTNKKCKELQEQTKKDTELFIEGIKETLFSIKKGNTFADVPLQGPIKNDLH